MYNFNVAIYTQSPPITLQTSGRLASWNNSLACDQNAQVHFKCADGLTSAQHKQPVRHMNDLLMIGPEDLLEEDRALLHEDSRELGTTAPCDQRYWIAFVESAFSTACHVHRREYFDLSPEVEFDDLGENAVHIDTQGSIRYQKQKRRRMDSR